MRFAGFNLFDRKALSQKGACYSQRRVYTVRDRPSANVRGRGGLMAMTPEQKAREKIDKMLSSCGWAVQDRQNANLSAARDVTVAELSFKTGEPDYTLFVDDKTLGAVEAKPEGNSLVGVEEQSAKYVIRDHVASSLRIEPDDFDYAPFSQQGGLGRAHRLFGVELPNVINELNDVLAA